MVPVISMVGHLQQEVNLVLQKMGQCMLLQVRLENILLPIVVLLLEVALSVLEWEELTHFGQVVIVVMMRRFMLVMMVVCMLLKRIL